VWLHGWPARWLACVSFSFAPAPGPRHKNGTHYQAKEWRRLVIGSQRVRLLIPMSNSLKDKRSVLKKTIHRLRTHYNCAVAEVDDQDIWRSAVLAIVTVAANRAQVDSLLATIGHDLETAADFEVIDEFTEYL